MRFFCFFFLATRKEKYNNLINKNEVKRKCAGLSPRTED
jgi:hypothetical protein